MQDGQGERIECTRRAMLRAMTVAAAMVVEGCERDDTERDALTVLVQSEPAHLDPRFPMDALSATLSRLVYDALVDIDPDTLTYRPSLARSIEQVDPLHIRAVLRSDARFHDGTSILATDVVATFEALMDPGMGSPSRSTISQTITSVRARGEREVEFSLREPTGIALLVLAQPIVRASDARKPELASEPGNEHAFIGSGRMRVASLTRNAWTFERIRPERHKPRRVRFLTVKDANTMALRLLHRRADVAEVKPELFPLFMGREGFTLAHARGVAVAYLPLRNDHPRLARREVRRALAHAIDRPSLVQGKFAGYAIESTGILPPWHWAYEGNVRRYPYDPARARQMLDATWPKADRTRETLVFRCSNQRFVLTTAAAITEMLRAVDVRVELRPSELAVLLADLRAGRYDVALLQAPDVSEPHILWTLFASDARPTAANPRAGLNRWRFSNPAFDAAVNDGRRAVEREQRRKHYAIAQRILAEELPVIPLWHPDVVFVGSPRVAQLRSRGDARFDTLLDVRLRQC